MSRPALRRSLIAVAAALATGAGFVVAAVPASAAGPWFVATTGNNAATCLTAAAPCATIAGAIAKPGFANGDTINVAAGTYVGQTGFGGQGRQRGRLGNVVLDGNNSGTYSTVVRQRRDHGQPHQPDHPQRVQQSLRRRASVWWPAPSTPPTSSSGTTRAPSGPARSSYQGATLNMTGGSITNNTSTATGAPERRRRRRLRRTARPAHARPASSPSTASRSPTTWRTGAALLFTGNGGGVFNAGTTVIKNSTFSGNRAVASTANLLRSGQGGAIFNGAQDSDDVAQPHRQNTTITGGLAVRRRQRDQRRRASPTSRPRSAAPASPAR